MNQSMKKLVSLLAVTLLLSVSLQAQESSSTNPEPKFGIKAGFTSIAVRASYQGSSASESSSGFYAGLFADFYLSENFNFQPELTYARYTEDGESSEVLMVPLLFKYKPIAELGLLAGPQMDYLLDELDGDFIKRFGFGIALGLSYDISENVIIDSRYTFGLSNRLEDNPFVAESVKVVFNYFQVGLAYRF
jgi:opacity protein-like surface antigen